MLNLSLKNRAKSIFLRIKNWFFEIFVPAENNKYLPRGLQSKYLFLYGVVLILVKIAIISLVLIWPHSSFFSAITQQRLLDMINNARAQNGLSQVALNSQLAQAANLKLADMFSNDYFEHTSPSGITPWFWFKKAGYNYEYAGENLAINFSQSEDVFNAWMQSPAHRENILNANFNEIGLAVKNDKLQNQDATLAVLVFGKQQKTTPAVSKTITVAKITPSPTAQPAKTSTAPAAQAPNVQKNTSGPLPTSTPEVLPAENPTDKTLLENIQLQQAEIAEQKTLADNPADQTQNSKTANQAAVQTTSRVLGAFVSRTDEAVKSFYLYFTLFLTLALLVNVVVKMEIQHWSTIFSAIFIIFISCLLIFV